MSAPTGSLSSVLSSLGLKDINLRDDGSEAMTRLHRLLTGEEPRLQLPVYSQLPFKYIIRQLLSYSTLSIKQSKNQLKLFFKLFFSELFLHIANFVT